MLKKSKLVLSFVIFTFLALQAPAAENNNSEQFTPRTVEGWAQHLNEIKLKGTLQQGCQPFYKAAEGKAKGSVMLFHGYTACPQQYEELAPILAGMGYNVFVPLLPGHGKTAEKTGDVLTDQSTGLPDEKSVTIYKNFADRMSAILRDEPGTKVVGGLSLGGVMAARAMIDNPDIYERGFILAPFFDAASPYGFFIPTVGELVPDKQISWGEGCEKQRQLGRAGYCNFKITNISAIRRFGQDTLKEINKIKKPVQVSGVEKDPSAANSAIARAKKNLPDSYGCFFAEGASHSMISRQDNAGKDMFWLNPLLEQLARYIDTGRRFDQVGKSEYGMKQCRSY
jgi:esterase/lipase